MKNMARCRLDKPADPSRTGSDAPLFLEPVLWISWTVTAAVRQMSSSRLMDMIMVSEADGRRHYDYPRKLMALPARAPSERPTAVVVAIAGEIAGSVRSRP